MAIGPPASRAAVPDTAELAVALAMAIKRLRARMGEESGAGTAGLTLTQLAVIERLLTEGPMTASALAAAEHVSQQAIAQSLATLKAQGLVVTRRDRSDRRKTQITATAAARRFRARLREGRDAWLVRALEATLTARERAALQRAVGMLERVADADLHPAAELPAR
jgi:DNA-binding MarR family transcriptional regulator